MKTVREIRDEADLLYQKSSHYIVATFISIGTIVAFLKSLLEIVGLEVGIDYLFLAAVLFSPLEYGMVKASLLAYEHKARLVKTQEATLSGLAKYFKIMVPFVGRTLMVYIVQILILAIFTLATAHSMSEFMLCLKTVMTGSLDYIRSDGQLIIYFGSLLGIIFALVGGFLLEAAFSLSYYFVVEKDMGLFKSLSSSVNYMKGNFGQYIILRLSYLPYAIVSSIVSTVVTISFKTLFQQLLTLMPGVPLIVFNLILALIVAFVSSLVSVMIYKVKETLAITVFYKEIEASKQ